MKQALALKHIKPLRRANRKWAHEQQRATFIMATTLTILTNVRMPINKILHAVKCLHYIRKRQMKNCAGITLWPGPSSLWTQPKKKKSPKLINAEKGATNW